MQTLLAERLLATVMDFSRAQLVEVRPSLQTLAAWKCDEYEQYWPGQRFIESLASWLDQFKAEHRAAALEFVRKRLFFHSRTEMQHLVGMAFADFVKPQIMRAVAAELDLPWYSVGKIGASNEYKLAIRRTLFLGLSDGAHIDVFRRSNPHLSNEQIWLTYELSTEKISDLRKELERDLEQLKGSTPTIDEVQFQHLVLLDDFSGSGKSYVRDEDGKPCGKLAKIAERLQRGEFEGLVAKDASVLLVLYLATEQARQHIADNLSRLPVLSDTKLFVVHPLPPTFPLSDERDADILALVDSDKYYDKACESRHTGVGGTDDVKRGFGACALPLVLTHNTPNNSVFLLWSFSHRVQGLFPRVTRH